MFVRVWQAVGRNRGRAAAACAVVLAAFAAFAASHAASAANGLLKVRTGGDQTQTRIVIDLDRAANPKLLSDGSADRRVVVMLPGVTTTGDGLQGAGRGLVKTWMVDQTNSGARLQMDLSADAKVKRRFLLPPADGIDHYRYVLDVAPTAPGEVKLTKAQSVRPLKLRRELTSARSQPLPLKKVIVIDAGHGGNDPGARGALGFEKDINLAAAQALKARLERTGRYKVVMTRSADVYVPLESRVRIAQRSDADLFISLHADAAPEADLRGVSVYTLSDKASSRAAKFVSKDDWFMKASLSGDRGVSDILFDLTQRATRNRSAIFAQTLVSHMEGKAPLLRRSHRDAGFMVLLAPNVPAVLLEMGFVSNTEDERLLRDPERRGQIVAAVANSIDDYFGEAAQLAAR
jgi:N-acetylmuramoyl-L-alanine amidase